MTPVALNHDVPTYEQLVWNEGALIRELIDSYAETCLDDFRTKVLGLY